MSDLLKKVAKLLGVPESLIQRSSEARAEASGKSTEEVLQSWAGGEPVATEETTEEPVAEEEAPAEESEADKKDYDQVSIFGKKIGMSRIFLDEGNDCPVTVIEAGPCYVTQIKTKGSEGYNSIQISYGAIKKNQINKASKGHYGKSQ